MHELKIETNRFEQRNEQYSCGLMGNGESFTAGFSAQLDDLVSKGWGRLFDSRETSVIVRHSRLHWDSGSHFRPFKHSHAALARRWAWGGQLAEETDTSRGHQCSKDC